MNFDVFSVILQPIIICDADGNVVYGNDACELTFGLSDRQIQRKIFPDFLKMNPAFPWKLGEIQQTTLYREATFDTGKRTGAVRYSVQPLNDGGEPRWMVCFHDSTLEISLQQKYKEERRATQDLSKEVIGKSAELQISQQMLERLVSQMSFLLTFYGRTRFVLETHSIASEFMQMACENLGFRQGLFFHLDAGSGALRLDSQVLIDADTDADRRLRTKISRTDFKFPFEAMVTPIRDVTRDDFRNSDAGAFYGRLGIADPQNAAIINLKDGERVVGQIHLINFAQLPDIDETTMELLTYMIDPLELTFRNAELYRASVTDELTQLSNVRYFRIRLATEIERSEKSAKPVSLLMIDLDHFKKINDTYGHPVGDEVIRATAAQLKANVRTTDTPARYGGEEMAVILPNCTAEHAVKVAEKIRMSLEKLEIVTEKGPLKFTASLGVATYPDHADNRESLIEKADQALYRAKHGGRNRVAGL